MQSAVLRRPSLPRLSSLCAGPVSPHPASAVSLRRRIPDDGLRCSPIRLRKITLPPPGRHLSRCRLHPIRAAAAAASSSSSDPPAKSSIAPSTPPAGAKLVPLALAVAIGLGVRFLVPKPVEITTQAWQLLSIFLSTVAGLVLNPLPVGAWAFLGLTTAVLTKTLPFATAFGAYTNEVIWLIVISFFFARGFVKTGLGDRVATYFVKWLGKSTLGLSYGLTISEALIAPAMPSTTARAGGVFLPIIKSLSLSAGSRPGDPSARKLGSYLVQSQLQGVRKGPRLQHGVLNNVEEEKDGGGCLGASPKDDELDKIGLLGLTIKKEEGGNRE
ncbi:hypothetical protein Taro_011780 [Colocasia esculenta]|uniref:Uncharacterized protein n=1 Tax=Colocasia esculenta TaxID=4460 RepID=A0A843UBU9_COLES|nr:hypothetical protein [Colocasia esculenta]